MLCRCCPICHCCCRHWLIASHQLVTSLSSCIIIFYSMLASSSTGYLLIYLCKYPMVSLVICTYPLVWTALHTHTHNRFTTLFPGPPMWAGARRKLLHFMVQDNRGRHTDHLTGCHSIRTNQCPPQPSPHFYRPDALPATQPTVSKHWRQLVHSD